MNNSFGYRGYIASREVRGENTPQHVQNLIIREYAKKYDLLFLLSATEYAMPSCYMMLEAVVKDLKALDGMIMFSLFMLPKDVERRNAIYKQFLETNSELHCALEDLRIKSETDIALLEDIYQVNAYSAVDMSLFKVNE